MGLFNNHKTALGNFYDPMGLFGGKKKNNLSMIRPEPYSGLRPYSGADVGLGADALAPLSQQYRSQIMERSQGKGLVGFDPEHRSLLKSEFTQDLDQQEAEKRRQDQAQAASQGLRGGIPLSISAMRGRDFSRARASGLANIDIADLEANREDRNTATYAQPELVQLGSGIQQNRANFDLAEWQASQPTYIDQPQSNLGPALLTALGTAAGGYFGGPSGAAAGNGLAQSVSQGKTANRSIQNPSLQLQGLLNYLKPRGASTLY